MTARDRAIRQLWEAGYDSRAVTEYGCEYLIQLLTLAFEIQDAERAYTAFAQTDYR